MRNKILAELVKKFPGLSKTFLGLIADKMAPKVTEESGIDQAITDFDNAVSIKDLATEFQKDGDRRVSDAKKEWDKAHPKKDKEETEEETEEEETDKGKKGKTKKPSDEPPAWAKALMQQVQTLAKDKTATSIQTKLADKLKDKVPASYYAGWALPEKEEEFDDFVAKIETSYTEFTQELTNKGLLSTVPPAGGNGEVKASGKEEADIKAWAEKNKPKETAK